MYGLWERFRALQQLPNANPFLKSENTCNSTWLQLMWRRRRNWLGPISEIVPHNKHYTVTKFYAFNSNPIIPWKFPMNLLDYNDGIFYVAVMVYRFQGKKENEKHPWKQHNFVANLPDELQIFRWFTRIALRITYCA